MQRSGIHQWTDNYPTRAIIENDLEQGSVFVLKCCNRILGAIVLSEDQETEYQQVNWKFDNSNVLVIHRLAIDPTYQGCGYASNLMDFAEKPCGRKRLHFYPIRHLQPEQKVVSALRETEVTHTEAMSIFPNGEFPFFCLEKGG